MTFSEQFIYAMFKPSKYKEMLELKRSRFVWFVIVMALVLSIVTFAVPVAARIAGFGGFEKLFTEKMSPMVFEDGELNIEKPFKMTFGILTFVIDTEEDAVSDEKMVKDGYYVALGKKYMSRCIVLDGQRQSAADIELDTMIVNGVDNQKLVSLVPALYTSLVLCFIFVAGGMFCKYAFFALILALLINSMNKRLDAGMPFGKCFAMCFYAQTLAMIISNFNSAIGLLPGFIVSIFGVMYTIHMMSAANVLMLPKNQL